MSALHWPLGKAERRMVVESYISRLKRRLSGSNSPFETPEGTLVYAIGDIHGRLDLLQNLIEQISRDADRSVAPRKLLIFLGDYVDRGWQSKEVLDLLSNLDLDGFETVFLKGNHEEALLSFLNDPAFLETWRQFGGLETLHSYGLKDLKFRDDADYQSSVHREFAAAFPARHLAFLEGLPTSYTLDGYFFVHAGVKPGVALDQQNDHDLCWIRNEFLDSHTNFGKRVVHGHCPEETPQVRKNRIGIDTGAYITGVLTAAVLEGADVRFLQTAD